MFLTRCKCHNDNEYNTRNEFKRNDVGIVECVECVQCSVGVDASDSFGVDASDSFGVDASGSFGVDASDSFGVNDGGSVCVLFFLLLCTHIRKHAKHTSHF